MILFIHQLSLIPQGKLWEIRDYVSTIAVCQWLEKGFYNKYMAHN